MAFARSVATTHTKTLISPSTGSADLVYGADYVSATSHTSTPAVSGATSGGIPYFDSATSEASSALLAQYGVVMGGGAGNPPLTSVKLTEGSAAGQGLIVTAGTAASAVSGLSLTQTWNFNTSPITMILANATNTSSHAGTLLMDLQVGSASKFAVGKGGEATSQSYFFAITQLIGDSGGIRGNSVGWKAGNNKVNGFASTTDSNDTLDTGWSRGSAGVHCFGTGAQGSTAGTVSAAAYVVGGTTGADFGPGLPTSITVVKGIITAIS